VVLMPSFRSIFCVLMFALVAYVVVENATDKLIVGACIAWGGVLLSYYFSSTKAGSDTATKNAEAVAAAAINNASPQQVEVVNDAAKPGPTVET
jgi:multisubunit Na+/H+ antiporter MnhC subunit